MGIVQCPFKLGGHSFELHFIVCQNLIGPVILGLDIMRKHQIGLSWSDMGKGLLTLEDKMLVETVDICEMKPQLLAYSSLTVPPRILAVIDVHVYLKGNSMEHTSKVKPNGLLMDQYPNMVIMPVIHIMPKQTDTVVPFVIINMPIS